MARTLPYFEASMARLNLQEAEPIVDKLAPAKETLNTVQKFVNQQEEAKTANVLAKARSDWNIKMNKLQQDTGLDAEGFSDKVGDMLLNEEQRYLEQIPLAQRQKFKEQFSTLKYDFLSKANIYENQALAEKMVVNVRDTINLNANSIISDYTQRDKLTYQTDAMIDGLNLPKSTADALKKESRETYVISEINALTSFSPETLLKNLNSGLYDKDIDSSKKAAAITQAKAKIKSNEVEAKKIIKEQNEQIFNDDYQNIVSGKYSRLDVINLMPKYKNNMKNFDTLLKTYDKLEENGILINQTAIDLDEGKLNGFDKTSKTRINMFYDASASTLDGQDNAESFLAKRNLTNQIVSKSGFIPDSFSQELRYKMNSSDYMDVANAGVSYYEAKQLNRNVVSSLKDYEADKLYYIGLAHSSGKNIKDIINILRVEPSTATLSDRTTAFNKMNKDGKIKGDLDVDDVSASNAFDSVVRFWYLQTGDLDMAEKMGEEFVNTNYEYNVIGTGEAGLFEKSENIFFKEGNYEYGKRVRAKQEPIFRGPMKEYGSLISGRGLEEKRNILARDLLKQTKEAMKGWLEIPSYENITISNDNKRFVNGKPAYLVSYKGIPLINENRELFYWVPDVVGYSESDIVDGE